MATTSEIQPGQRIDLTRQVVGSDRTDRRAALVEQVPGQPPQRIDGLTIGAPQITSDAPHDGEVHPDGDEVPGNFEERMPGVAEWFINRHPSDADC